MTDAAGHIDAARRLVPVLAEEGAESLDCAYVAGSLTAGLGNPTSDIDLFVLGRGVPDRPSTQYNIDGHRVDVERYSLAHLEGAVDDVLSYRVRRESLAELHELCDKLDFAIRLHLSETVVDSPTLSRVKARLTASTGAVRRTMLNYLAVTVNSHLEDFLGAAAEGDFDTAALVGQELVAYAGKAIAAAAGDLYFSRKWVYKQLRRSPVAGFPVERFAGYQRGTWTTDGAAGAEGLMFFAQTCLAASQLLGGAGRPVSAWPSWTPGNEPSGAWRNPAYCVLRQDDGILLHWELHRQVVLKEHVAAVWALCDGHSPAQIAARVERLAEAVPSLRALTPSRIDRILSTLQDRNLVSDKPFPVLDMV